MDVVDCDMKHCLLEHIQIFCLLQTTYMSIHTSKDRTVTLCTSIHAHILYMNRKKGCTINRMPLSCVSYQ